MNGFTKIHAIIVFIRTDIHSTSRWDCS